MEMKTKKKMGNADEKTRASPCEATYRARDAVILKTSKIDHYGGHHYYPASASISDGSPGDRKIKLAERATAENRKTSDENENRVAPTAGSSAVVGRAKASLPAIIRARGTAIIDRIPRAGPADR